MEVTETYTNLGERQTLINLWEAQKYRMVSDTYTSDWKPGDEPCGILVFNNDAIPPIIPIPPCSTHLSILEAVDPTKARPAKVKRTWSGKNYHYDCFATQTVKDEYVAGKIQIGDYVIVYYDDRGEQVVTAKVWKSW